MEQYTKTYASPAQLASLLRSRGLILGDERPWISAAVSQQKVYFSLCVIKYFLDIISPSNDMTEKLQSLFKDYPTVDINAMGVPVGWEQEALWQ